MTNEKHLYRASNSLVGGVCAGAADYFNIDPIVVRILTVLLTLMSGGLFALVYVALWIILPPSPKADIPYEIKPESVHSETYGQVDYSDWSAGIPKDNTARAADPSAQWHATPATYQCSGHIPPEPPIHYAGFSESYGDPQAKTNSYRPVDAASAPYVSPAVGPESTHGEAKPASGTSVKAALWFGFICLSIGLAALLGHFVDGVSWWQLWPLIFVVTGIGKIVIPGNRGYRVRQFVDGVIGITFGASLLLMTVGIIDYRSLWQILGNLWPLLLMMVGFSVLSSALKLPIFTLLSGACFVAFCFAGLMWFSAPGETETLTVELPYRPAITLDVNPWI